MHLHTRAPVRIHAQRGYGTRVSRGVRSAGPTATAASVFDNETDVGISLIKIYRDLD